MSSFAKSANSTTWVSKRPSASHSPQLPVCRRKRPRPKRNGSRSPVGNSGRWGRGGLAPWPESDWAISATSETIAPADLVGANVRERSSQRVSRLEGLLILRKLYRNFLRAEYQLAQPSPVYEKLQSRYEEESKRSPPATDEEKAEREKEVKYYVLKIVADMSLTSEQLKSSVRSLSPNMASLFPMRTGDEALETVKERALTYATDLKRRVSIEIPTLPFPSKYLHRAVADARAKKPIYRYLDEDTVDPPGPMQRLGKAEKAAEKFVAGKLQQVRETTPEDYLENIQDTAVYLREFWGRLNGRGRGNARSLLPTEVPRPASIEQECKTVSSQLSLELEKLEKNLQEASKARESKLRGAALEERLQLAFQLKMMDEEVLELTRLSAVRSLQFQMEYIYLYLEEEALDISEDARAFGHIARRGSTEELTLLAAEFGILDEQLSTLVETLLQTPSVLVQDNLLQNLIEEIDDLRKRLGISPEMVFGSSGLSLRKIELQLQEGQAKLLEGCQFGIRGVRLLSSDLANAGKLFSRAALGGTLKPREVAALRRTFRDLFTFVPFVIILIIPLTPVGHVLVFGFLQRFFPDLFPSQFTTRRQNIMTRYDVLRQKLMAARNRAEEAEEEAELVRAQEAVARLTAPPTAQRRVATYNDGGRLDDRLKKLQDEVAVAANEVLAASEDEV